MDKINCFSCGMDRSEEGNKFHETMFFSELLDGVIFEALRSGSMKYIPKSIAANTINMVVGCRR